MTDTIAAIATAQGPGGIGIVRVSGPGAVSIAQRLFRPAAPPDWQRLRGYSMLYGTLDDIDEAICLVFRAPHSYTGEDVVEFQCHGGFLVLRRALEAVLNAGALPAGPGEFTRRAYFNGRIDLAKAEAIMQLVAAQSEQALRAAHAAMGGALSQGIEKTRSALVALAAHLGAWLDYPEEDIEALRDGDLEQVLREAAQSLQDLLGRARSDQAVISGVSAALLGRPNVGKSSLMNRLVGYDRSIVTEFPGTTRDTVSETVQLGNLTLRLTDTAGLRATQSPIERAGVDRAVEAMGQADLLLAVFDVSQSPVPEDQALLAQCDPARTLLLRNKIDLGIAWPPPPGYTSVDVSALTGQGLDALAPAAERLLGAADFSPGEAILANRRQADCAAAALAAIEEALAAHAQGFPLDAVAVCLEDAIQSLFALTGERASDAVVDEVFAGFCVGK